MNQWSPSDRPRYDRLTAGNRGIVPQSSQDQLAGASIAVAGMSADGGESALMLARLGIGRLRLVEADDFDVSHTSHQAGCATSTYGRNKAEVVAGLIRDLNPAAIVQTFPEGVTSDNVDLVVDGCDVVVDQLGHTRPAQSVLLHRSARRIGRPVVLGLSLGFGCVVTSFTDTSQRIETFLGLPGGSAWRDGDGPAALPLERYLAGVPSYVHPFLLHQIADGMPNPGVSPGTALAASLTCVETLRHLLDWNQVVVAPHMIWLDARDLRLTVVNRLETFG